MNLKEKFWTERYHCGNTGWDIGYASPPLIHYMEKWPDRKVKVLIPGAGNAYEAEYLHKRGYRQIWVADISDVPLQQLKNRCPDFPENHLLHGDFFQLEGPFEVILEQTFFCALHPGLRSIYLEKMHALLKPGGCLAGVLFDKPLFSDRPPFGGSEEEYRKLFSQSDLDLVKMETAYNSIPERQGSEVFFIARKPI